MAGNAARVNIPTVADVDPDVADSPFLAFAESENVTRKKTARVALDSQTGFRLLFRRARDVQLKRRHDILNQSAAIEAFLRRAAPCAIPGADLRPRNGDDGIAKEQRRVAVGFERLGCGAVLRRRGA